MTADTLVQGASILAKDRNQSEHPTLLPNTQQAHAASACPDQTNTPSNKHTPYLHLYEAHPSKPQFSHLRILPSYRSSSLSASVSQCIQGMWALPKSWPLGSCACSGQSSEPARRKTTTDAISTSKRGAAAIPRCPPPWAGKAAKACAVPPPSIAPSKWGPGTHCMSARTNKHGPA